MAPRHGKRHPYDQWAPDTRALDMIGDKWTLVIVRDLLAGHLRFVELQRTLPGISTEQLRTRLNWLVEIGVLDRTRIAELPPRTDYELTSKGLALKPLIAAAARWGMLFNWSSPLQGEHVDVGAVLRLAPALVAPIDDPHPPAKMICSVERATVRQPDGRSCPATRSFAIDVGDEVTVVELEGGAHDGELAEATVHVHGVEPAWISALSPGGSPDNLAYDGDERLGVRVLAELGGAQVWEPLAA